METPRESLKKHCKAVVEQENYVWQNKCRSYGEDGNQFEVLADVTVFTKVFHKGVAVDDNGVEPNKCIGKGSEALRFVEANDESRASTAHGVVWFLTRHLQQNRNLGAVEPGFVAAVSRKEMAQGVKPIDNAVNVADSEKLGNREYQRTSSSSSSIAASLSRPWPHSTLMLMLVMLLRGTALCI